MHVSQKFTDKPRICINKEYVKILVYTNQKKKKKKKKETPHENFLKILYKFEALRFCFLFKFYCFSYESTSIAFVISERFSGKNWTLNSLSVFSGYRHYLNIEK